MAITNDEANALNDTLAPPATRVQLGTIIQQAQTDIATLQGGVSDIGEDITAIEGDVSTLQGDVSDLQDQIRTVEMWIPGGEAANADFHRSIFVAPADLDVVGVFIAADGAIGQASNYLAIHVNEYEAGASRQNLGLISVDDQNTLAALIAEDIFAGSGSVSTVNAGNTITVKKTAVGDGQAWPGGVVQLRYVLADEGA